jgi:hypothetical protein
VSSRKPRSGAAYFGAFYGFRQLAGGGADVVSAPWPALAVMSGRPYSEEALSGASPMTGRSRGASIETTRGG